MYICNYKYQSLFLLIFYQGISKQICLLQSLYRLSKNNNYQKNDIFKI